MDSKFGLIPLEFSLEFTLKNIFKSSSQVMDNSSLPPLSIMPLYSIAKDGQMRNIRPPHSYSDADLVVFALNVVEGIDFR